MIVLTATGNLIWLSSNPPIIAFSGKFCTYLEISAEACLAFLESGSWKFLSLGFQRTLRELSQLAFLGTVLLSFAF